MGGNGPKGRDTLPCTEKDSGWVPRKMERRGGETVVRGECLPSPLLGKRGGDLGGLGVKRQKISAERLVSDR